LVSLYSKDPNVFHSILFNGYQVKFITMRGLQGLLELKFNKKAGSDYVLTERGIEQLKIDKHDLHALHQFLSKNWVIEETGKTDLQEISIQLI